jgi:tetratricopeptide (TPR) repeat protein
VIAESLGQLLEPRDEKAALVNFQAGMLAEEWVDWRTAYQHYARAAELEPGNWRYVQQAGNLAWRVGEYETAADHHESVLGTVLAGFDTQSHETAAAMNALAIAYVALARYAEAEPLLRTASTISEKTLGEKHRDVATGYNNLAVLLEQQGKLDEAESTYRKALDIARSSLGRKHRDTRSTDRNLKQLLVERATTQSP